MAKFDYVTRCPTSITIFIRGDLVTLLLQVQIKIRIITRQTVDHGENYSVKLKISE